MNSILLQSEFQEYLFKCILENLSFCEFQNFPGGGGPLDFFLSRPFVGLARPP